MMSRRAFGEMLSDVGGGVLDALATDPGISVRDVRYTLPVEFALSRSGDDVVVLGDVPRLITRTAFDLPTTRVEFTCVAQDLA
jgi:hypothetical protein